VTKKSTSLRIAGIIKALFESGAKNASSRFAYTQSGKKICARCVSFNQKRFALDESWQIINDPVNTLDPYLFCDHCQGRIKQASK
jgi:hypothetical protein